jgi:quercetin dioxygenase-like cupin family protein
MNKEIKMNQHEEENTKLTRLPELAQPLLQFDLAAEIEHLHREDSWQRGAGRSSKTLVKQPDFRVVLVAMKEATEIKEHRADGRISIHTITGHLRLKLPDQVVEVPAGHLLALDRCIGHDVEALADSVFLLTIAWPKHTA